MSKFFKTIIAFAFLSVLPFSASAEVTFVSWGGAYTESQIKAYGDTYSDPDSIIFEPYNGGLGEIRAQVESGNVAWDIVDVLPSEAITGCDEGLFEDLSDVAWAPAPDGTSMADDLAASGVTIMPPCCAPQIFWTYVAFYDPDNFPGNWGSAKPEGIADFFDVGKFPGKRGVHTWANAIVEMALVADGVAAGDVYGVLETAEGIDRAFAKLDTIKDHIIHWSAGSKPLELVKSGEVVMSLAYNGRIGAANMSEGENFEYIWEGQVIEQEYICLMNGAPNRDAAIDFMIHASSSESQAEQAKYITYGPMRASGIDIIAAGEPWFHTGVSVLDQMPNTPDKIAISVIGDPTWWADNGSEISERYGAWMGN